ncbi:MAG: DsbC family protein [Rhodanobacter sp.]
MLKRLLLMCLLGLVSSTAACADSTSQTAAPASNSAVSPAVAKMVQQAIHKLSSKVEVDSIQQSPLPGFYQVIASGQMVYVSADGKYLMHGDLVDLSSQRNVGDAGWARYRKEQLAKVPAAQRIVYAPTNPKYTITVFTDVNCGFCRALHEHIAAFNKEGIAVEYLAWPREGVLTTSGKPTPTYTEMVSVWCAKDRKAAFDIAKTGKAPPPLSCSNPVKDQFDLGLKLGVSGTPTIYGPDGTVLGGYVTPEQLLQALKARS